MITKGIPDVEREQWRMVLRAVKRAARQVDKAWRPKRLRFADWQIVAMFLWAVAHDRPQSWACDARHYTTSVFRPRRLPSVSQFNRRMNQPRTRAVLQRVHEALAGAPPTEAMASTALSYLDGKPLTVGVASKDPDARRGHVMGGFARGYKLHAWMSEDRRIPIWCVTPLNTHEAPVAQALVDQVTTALPDRSLVLADQNYDSHDLHKRLDARNGRLLVRPKEGGKRKAKRTASSPTTVGTRHPVTLRQMGPARRELLSVVARHPNLFRIVHRQRANAEGILGNLCGYGGGLTGLPPWARRMHRVRRWVGGKIIMYHARLRTRTRVAAAA